MPLRALYDLPAPAKLNLFLHVVGRREDGFHLLQSIFVLIDWADTLHAELRGDGRLQRHDLGPALPADDLVLQAARALRQASGTPLGADLSVHKQVPWGAGLGGGSSDAATTLIALNRLWGLDWSRARLVELGLAIGADVPFFLGGENAFVEGIGERLTPIAWDPREYCVVKPPQAIATEAIFNAPDLARDTKPATLEGSLTGLKQVHQAWGRNDLQPVAERLCPAVAWAACFLESRYGNSRMTGSGSAVFSDLGRAGAYPVTSKEHSMAPLGESSGDVRGGDGFGGDGLGGGGLGGGDGSVGGLELPEGWIARRCRSLDHHPLRDWAG